MDGDGNNIIGFPIVDPLIPQDIHQLLDDSIISRSKPSTMSQQLLAVIGIQYTTSDSADENSSQLEELDF